MPARRLHVPRRAVLLAAAAALALAAASASFGARTATMITVKAPSELRLAGTDIYCTVGTSRGATTVACARFPAGRAKPPQGLAIVASDAAVAVERVATSAAVRSARNAPTLAAVGVIPGGTAYPQVVTLGLHQAAYIGGSRMIVLVEPAAGGGNAIGVLFLDAKGRPVRGTFSVGISTHSVTMISVTISGAPKVVYRHSVLG